MDMPTISLLYQDRHLIVCEKPAGILTQPDAAHPSDPASDMLAALSQQLSSSHHPTPEIYPVHRLDRGVGGIMVFASSRAAAGKLSDMVAKRAITKQYLAVVHGHPTTEKGMLEDLLYRDAATGKSYVSSRPRPGAKEAALTYEQRERLNDSPVGPCSLLKITLHTGRTHQIRVQFSSRSMPLVGDGKYGARDHGCPLGLWSYRIAFDHPFRRHEVVDFSLLPPAVPPFSWFSSLSLPQDTQPAPGGSPGSFPTRED